MEEVELNEITTCGQISLLYEAAYNGDVSMLNSLIQQRPHILHKTSQTSFTETPLHISSLLGHLQFTKKLVTYKPSLALEVDSSRMTPLHLASAEGHIDIVKELLKVHNEPCLFPDEEGRIPLHYAAMRGRTEVVQELIKVKPESLNFCDNGKTVFHLCVTYNHLETLRALVESESGITGELFNFISSDNSGNTILHLAVMLKRVEVVGYLLSIPEIREIAKLKNNMGFTAHNILEQSPKDFKICEIQHMLTKAEKDGGIEINHPNLPAKPASKDVVPPRKGGRWIKMFHNIRKFFVEIFTWIEQWWMREDQWLKEMRGNLSLVSTVIATISFQALINPPGGFFQQGLGSKEDTTSLNDGILACINLPYDIQYCPGQALSSSITESYKFKNYIYCVTVAFFSSLSVTLFLVSGIFPMKNKAVIWVLTIGMFIVLTALASAYAAAIEIIIPVNLYENNIDRTLNTVYVIWNRLLGVIIMLITLRLYIWVMKKCVMGFKKSKSWGREHGWGSFRLLFRIVVIFFMFVISSVLLGILVLVYWIFQIYKPFWLLG